MGRGRIRVNFRDESSTGEGATKSDSFASSSIPKADQAVFRELKAGVSKVESRIGIDLPQSNLGFKDGGKSIGVHFGQGLQRTVLLKKSFFNRTEAEIRADLRRMYKEKWLVDSTTPLQHIVVHELGHSVWVDRIEGQVRELQKLNEGIARLYTRFRRETGAGKTPISR